MEAVCITFESFFERFSYLVPGWGFCAATSLFSFLALSQRDSDLTFTLMHFPRFKVTSKSLKVASKRLKKVAFLGFHIFAHFSRQLKWSSFWPFIFANFFRENNRKPGFNGFLTWFNLADKVGELKRPKVVFLTKINGTRFESAPFVSAWAPKERLWILFGQSTADSASLGRCQHQPRITAQFHPFFRL